MFEGLVRRMYGGWQALSRGRKTALPNFDFSNSLERRPDVPWRGYSLVSSTIVFFADLQFRRQGWKDWSLYKIAFVDAA
jgi:hypothetical protein